MEVRSDVFDDCRIPVVPERVATDPVAADCRFVRNLSTGFRLARKDLQTNARFVGTDCDRCVERAHGCFRAK